MPEFPVPIQRISEEEMERLLREGYNPLQDGEDLRAFNTEWKENYEALKLCMSKNWNTDIRTHNNDVLVASDVCTDRMLSVELVNIRTLTDALLPFAYSTVQQLKGDYCVDFCNAWGCLEPVGGGEPHAFFNIFVSRRKIWIYSESDELFKELGIQDFINPKVRA